MVSFLYKLFAILTQKWQRTTLEQYRHGPVFFIPLCYALEILSGLFRGFRNNFLGVEQRHNQNLVKYLRWSVLRKWITSKSHYLFSQKVLSWKFGRVLNTPLLIILFYELEVQQKEAGNFCSFDILAGWDEEFKCFCWA